METIEYQNDIKNNLLTKDQLDNIINERVLLEINELRIITNTFVWSFININDLYNDLYNKFLDGFKNFQPVKVENDSFYIIEKDEYKNSL
jgi:hypothetical protein